MVLVKYKQPAVASCKGLRQGGKMKVDELKAKTEKFVDAWIEWHKPEYGAFPSDDVISTASDLVDLFGKEIPE